MTPHRHQCAQWVTLTSDVSYTKIPCNLRSTPSSGTQHWQNQSVSSSVKRNVRSWWHLKESSRGHTAVYPLLSIVNTLHPRSACYFLIPDILKADQRYYSHAVKHFVELPSAFLWRLLFRFTETQHLKSQSSKRCLHHISSLFCG